MKTPYGINSTAANPSVLIVASAAAPALIGALHSLFPASLPGPHTGQFAHPVAAAEKPAATAIAINTFIMSTLLLAGVCFSTIEAKIPGACGPLR